MFLALVLTTWGARTHGNDIRWRSDDSSSVPTLQASLQEKLGRLAVRANQTHLVVHFDGPVASEIRAELQEHGLTLLSFLGNHAYFASLANGNVDHVAIASVVGLNDATAIQRIWKVHPTISSDSYPDYALATSPITGESVVVSIVLFHSDVNLHPDAAADVSRHGGEIVSELFCSTYWSWRFRSPN